MWWRPRNAFQEAPKVVISKTPDFKPASRGGWARELGRGQKARHLMYFPSSALLWPSNGFLGMDSRNHQASASLIEVFNLEKNQPVSAAPVGQGETPSAVLSSLVQETSGVISAGFSFQLFQRKTLQEENVTQVRRVLS